MNILYSKLMKMKTKYCPIWWTHINYMYM